MVKKHYQALARALYGCRPTGHPETEDETAALGAWRDCVEAVSIVCRRDSTRFDPDLFEEACNTGERSALDEVR